MKTLKILATALLIGFAGIQFIPIHRNQSDIVPSADFIQVHDVPTEVETMLMTSCYDCHSNNTNYPWYSNLQPIGWMLQSHVEDGKAELNFNAWDEYSTRRKRSKIKSVISQIEDGEMPLSSYTLIHGDAKLSETERSVLIAFMTTLNDSL